MSRAEELRAAAEQLRQDVHSALADSPLPWFVDEDVVRCGTEGSIVVDRSCEPYEVGDMPYIARMHPGVGAALADWLDVEVTYLSDVEEQAQAGLAECLAHVHGALAVARAILGTQPRAPHHPYAHLDEDDDEQLVVDAGSLDDYQPEGSQP